MVACGKNWVGALERGHQLINKEKTNRRKQMVEILGNLCNAIGAYSVNVAVQVGDLLASLIGK